jgi:hypothetical protein
VDRSDPWRVPVHPDHRLALVGEAPGPAWKGRDQLAGRESHHWALYPYPERSAAARLKDMMGLTRTEYLSTFARANLLGYYPGPVFPVRVARECAAALAQRLAPRPLCLLGQGVAQAFRFPSKELLTWQDYVEGGC